MDVIAIGSVLIGSIIGGHQLSKAINGSSIINTILETIEFQGAVLVLILLFGGWSRSAWMCRRERRSHKIHDEVCRENNYKKSPCPTRSLSHCKNTDPISGRHNEASFSWPAVDLVIPVKGCGSHSRSNWSTILDLDYPSDPLHSHRPRFFFVVEEVSDPAVNLITSLIDDYPVRFSLHIVHAPLFNGDGGMEEKGEKEEEEGGEIRGGREARQIVKSEEEETVNMDLNYPTETPAIASKQEVYIIVAGHTVTCSQKLHNMTTGVLIARGIDSGPPSPHPPLPPHLRLFLFLDADVSLHPRALTQMARSLAEAPECLAATGYPIDLPPPKASLAAYATAAFHLPLLVPMTVSTRVAFVWGGCMMIRDSDLGLVNWDETGRGALGMGRKGDEHCLHRTTTDDSMDEVGNKDRTGSDDNRNRFREKCDFDPERQYKKGLGILEKWVRGGYSDDQCLNNLCATKGLMAIAPTALRLPQRLERRTTWQSFFNYLRRQLFVFHCYDSVASCRHNRSMMALGMAMGLQSSALPTLTVAYRLIKFFICKSSPINSSERNIRNLEKGCLGLPISTVVMAVSWGLAHFALVWFMVEATAMMALQRESSVSVSSQSKNAMSHESCDKYNKSPYRSGMNICSPLATIHYSSSKIEDKNTTDSSASVRVSCGEKTSRDVHDGDADNVASEVAFIKNCFKAFCLKTWIMVWLGIFIQSFVSPFVLIYVASSPPKIIWSGIEYTLKRGRVVKIKRK